MLRIEPAPPNPEIPQLGDIRQIERDFHQIVQVDPNNPGVYFVLGAIAHREGRHEAAIDALGKAIALDSTNPDYHCVLGSACAALGRTDAATGAFRAALELRPDEARGAEAVWPRSWRSRDSRKRRRTAIDDCWRFGREIVRPWPAWAPRLPPLAGSRSFDRRVSGHFRAAVKMRRHGRTWA